MHPESRKSVGYEEALITGFKAAGASGRRVGQILAGARRPFETFKELADDLDTPATV